ncbi:MAG TPA: hypothetical protein PKD55_19550 [Bellilinea sp.]|nr:hypothetical protein [Bellilinea sp.]
MATIIEKNPRRFRVQFSMSRSLYNEYQQCLHLAEEMKVAVDFGRDFEKWFSVQLEQANRELSKLKAQQHESVQSSLQMPAEGPRKGAAHGDDRE